MYSHAQAFRQYLKRREDSISNNTSHSPSMSNLYNENTFYRALISDMMAAKKEVIIYSPYASKFRMDFLKPTIEKLIDRNINIFIFTRPLEEYEPMIRPQIECSLKRFEEMGVIIFYPGRYIHQKVAIIDREIIWEGSLNILSHRSSNEMMRRVPDVDSAMQVLMYLGLDKYLAESYKLKYEKMYRTLLNKSKQGFLQKMRIFWIGFAAPIIIWWLFLSLRVMIISLKIAKTILSLIIFS